MARAMLTSVEGVYRNGQVELLEEPTDISEARVIVTFLPAASAEPAETVRRSVTEVDLRARGLDKKQAADLRSRLKAFAEDWEREDMQAYDAL